MNLLLILTAGIGSGCSNPATRAASAQLQPNGLYAPGVVHLGEDPVSSTDQNLEERWTNLQITKARLAVDDGQPHVARQMLESILESEPGHAEAAHFLAVLLTQSGELDAADKLFKIALASQSQQAQWNCDYGYFCYLVGRWDEARQHLTRAVEINPNLAKAQTNLGMLEARLGQTESARKRFQKAGCTEAEVLNNMAFAQLLQHDYSAAESTYTRALARNPDAPASKNGHRLASHLSKAAANETEGKALIEIPSATSKLTGFLTP
jgi:Tfp pilus assembly protein PilF